MKLRTLLLIALLVTTVMGQGRRGNRQMTWDESLNLTTEQMQQITELREAMQPSMQSMRQNTRDLQRELRTLLNSENADQDRIAELEASIASQESAIQALMEGHRASIRELLTAEQQVIFDQHEFGPREDRRGPRMGRTTDRPRGPRGGRPGQGRP